MKTKEVLVTPEQAALWLEKNTHNRPLRQRIVSQYAGEMRACRWLLHHQGIALNCDGTIIDGQHRLAAVVESGVSVRMLVTEGVDMAAQIAVDDHARRTPFDAISLADKFSVLSNKHVSVAGAMLRRCGGSGTLPSKQAIVAFLESHFDAVEFAVATCFSTRTTGLRQVSVSSVFGRAWYTAEHERLSQFRDVLQSGVMEDQDSVAAITLRNYLLQMRGKSGGAPAQQAIYKRTERCLRAFLDREQLRKCSTVERELFLLPGETE